MDNKLMMTEAIKHLMKIYVKIPMIHCRKEKVRLTLIKLISIYIASTEKKIQKKCMDQAHLFNKTAVSPR